MEEEEDDDEEAPALPETSNEAHFARLDWAATQALLGLAALPDDALLASWFSRVGHGSREVPGDLRAFSLGDALVRRDELEEAGSPELQAQRHPWRRSFSSTRYSSSAFCT